MDLLTYLNKIVRIVLPNGFYYIGRVIDVEEDDLTILDKNNNNISLRKEMIMSILEVQQW